MAKDEGIQVGSPREDWTFAQWVRWGLREKEWSQKKLAREVSVSASAVSKWLTIGTIPPVETAHSVEEKLNKGKEIIPPGTLKRIVEHRAEISDERFADVRGRTGFDLGSTLHRGRKVSQTVSQLAGAPRSKLIQAVRRIWIDGFLEDSMGEVVRIELGLVDDPRLVESSLALWTQLPEQRPTRLPAGTRLVEMFERFGGAMLIVGEPGVGKTTKLLELTKDLLDRATSDAAAPLPVVLNLTSWAHWYEIRSRSAANAKLTLAEWMANEIHRLYHTRPEVTRAWMVEGTLIALLDGLDEVAANYREPCARAIEAYRHDHGGPPVVVTCRWTQYERLSKRMRLEGAVLVESLHLDQVHRYLQSGGEVLAGLRAAVAADPQLMELLVTPLWLRTATLAYRNGGGTAPSPDAGGDGMPRDRRGRLYDRYIHEMFTRRAPPAYKEHETITYLGWLAKTLKAHNLTVLYIDQLQASWLPSSRERRLARIGLLIACGLTAGLIPGLVMGLVGAFWGALSEGLAGALAGGLGYGMTLAWISGLLGLIVGLGLRTGGTFVPKSTEWWPVRWRSSRPSEPITPTKTVRWSLSRMRHSLSVLAFGALVALIVGAEVWLLDEPRTGVLAGIFGLLLAGLLAGLSQELPDPGEGDDPYTVLRNSLRAGMTAGLIAGLVLGPLAALFFGPGSGLPPGMAGLAAAMVLGLLSWLFFGGHAFLHHLVIRWRLTQSGAAPWRYVEFLDHATDRLLLRRIGPGYVFVHRTLMDHLTPLEAPRRE